MKILKIAIISLLVVITLTIAALFIVPYAFKDRIISLVEKEANKSLQAKISFSHDIELSLFKSFPRLNVSILNTQITGIDSFVRDTLLQAEGISISIDAFKLYKSGEVVVHQVELNKPVLKLKVLKNGMYNWDIFKDDGEDTSVISGSLELFKINDGTLVYEDASLDFSTSLDNVQHTSSGKFTSDIFDLFTHTEASKFNISYGGMPILYNTDLIADATMHIDLEKDIYAFKENKFVVNELPIAFDGTFSFDQNDNTVMDLKWNAASSEVKNFLSLIPALYQNKFNDLKASGKLAFSGFMKGTYSDTSFPAYHLLAKIENGSFRYPQMPVPMDKISLDLLIDNPDGIDDHTLIDLKKLDFALKNDPFSVQLKASQPYSDPLIDMNAKGLVNFKNFKELIPFEEKTLLDGQIVADILVKGRKSALMNQKTDQFDAHGNIQATNITYQTASMPQVLKIEKGNLIFSTLYADIQDFKGSLGNNDLKANGRLENFFGYALDQQTLKGKINIESNYFNSNDFITESNQDENKTASTIIEVPGNIDFVLTSQIKKLVYDKYELNNFTGNGRVKDKNLQIDQLNTDLFGGTINLNGNYNTSDLKNPLVDMTLNLQKIEISKIFESVNTIKILAPIASYAKGVFSSRFSFKSLLNQDMSPVLTNLNCGGLLDLINVEISGSQSLNSIANQLNNNTLSKLNIKNKLLQFKIKDGKIFVEPFDLQLGDATLKLEGFTAIDQTIQYTGILSLPKEMLGNQQKFYDNLQKNSKFSSLNISPGDVLDIGLSITGMFKKPEVKLMLKEIKQKIGNQVKDALQNELDKQKQIAEERARAEMENAKIKAEEQARAVIEAEKKKAEAELERIKQEQKKKLEEEAKKRIKDALKKPPF